MTSPPSKPLEVSDLRDPSSSHVAREHEATNTEEIQEINGGEDGERRKESRNYSRFCWFSVTHIIEDKRGEATVQQQEPKSSA